MKFKKMKGALAILGIASTGIVLVWNAIPSKFISIPTADSSRLVDVREYPSAVCEWDYEPTVGRSVGQIASLQPQNLFAALLAAPQEAIDPYRRNDPLGAVNALTRPPDSRTLGDTYPTYTSVAVNLQTDEVVLQDNNLWSTRVFNRLDSTPPGAAFTQPKRVIQGKNTLLEYNNGVYVDPNNGDIYSVESDTGDRMTVFSRDAQGNVEPKRELYVPHRAYSMTINEDKQELYVVVEYPPEVSVYRKEASKNDAPIRRLFGDHTGLETPHGIAIDLKNRLLFIVNWGQYVSFDGSEKVRGCCRNLPREIGNPGTAQFHLPSIAVYPLDADGDTRPLRVIQGDRTQLNWPGNMSVDPDTGDLYVANDVGQSVLVFTGMTFQRGNVPPARVIKGAATGLRYPTGVFVDAKHQELWVTNLGNSSATVYPLKANGNVAPLRIIRSAPSTHESMTFGRTAAVAYDPNRQEILVPN
jgi:6-phosphogluconolactonase (cycloisomerase 2 family)